MGWLDKIWCADTAGLCSGGNLHSVQIVELKARSNSSTTLRVRILKLSGRSAANTASKGHLPIQYFTRLPHPKQ